MKFATIAPPSMLTEMPKSDYHLVLPHLLTSSDLYCDFYFNEEGFKILDNGEAEGYATDWDDLHHYATQYKCHEIVIPDRIGDCDFTVHRALSYKNSVDPMMGYMGVVQGQDAGEWMKCIYTFAELDYITTLGFPRAMAKEHPHQRYTLAKSIMEAPSLRDRFAIHFLGAHAWIREPALLQELNCRGMDSSLPVVMGLAGRDVVLHDYESRKEDFFDDHPNADLGLIIHNVLQYRSWCGAPTS